MAVKLIIKRNEYGSVKGGTRSQYKFSESDKAILKQLAVGGSEPAALGLSIRLLQVLTGDGDVDALIGDIVASVDYDNGVANRLWDISHYVYTLANKLAVAALDTRDAN